MESSRSFISALSTILSSTVFSVMKRKTRTCFCWPILWARSWNKKQNGSTTQQSGTAHTHIFRGIKKVQYFTGLTIACRSTWGFQSESYRMTTSAVAKLIPSPPALVLSMKMNLELLGSLYALIDICKHTKTKLILLNSFYGFLRKTD